jgi:hypothetical protein
VQVQGLPVQEPRPVLVLRVWVLLVQAQARQVQVQVPGQLVQGQRLVQGQLEELAWGQPVQVQVQVPVPVPGQPQEQLLEPVWAPQAQEPPQEQAMLVSVPEPQLGAPQGQEQLLVPVGAPLAQEPLQEQEMRASVPEPQLGAPQGQERLPGPVWAPLVQAQLLVPVSAQLVLEQLLEQDLVLGPLVHGYMDPATVDDSRNQTQIHSMAHLEERGIHLTRKVEEVDKEPLCTDMELGTEPEPLGSLYTVGEPGMDMVLVLGMFPLRRRV